MGLFTDFLQFVSSMLLGKQDSAKAFFEPLIMAERYLRWGAERNDLRDYRQALTHIDLARNDEAPKPEVLLRKYLCHANIIEGIVQLLLQQHRNAQEKATQDRRQQEVELVNVRGAAEMSRKKIAELEKEGSLIRSKEEGRHLAELEQRRAVMEATLQSDAPALAVADRFEQLVGENERLCQGLEQAILVLEMNPELSSRVAKPIRDQVDGRIASLRQQVQALDPRGGMLQNAPAPAPASPQTPGAS